MKWQANRADWLTVNIDWLSVIRSDNKSLSLDGSNIRNNNTLHHITSHQRHQTNRKDVDKLSLL